VPEAPADVEEERAFCGLKRQAELLAAGEASSVELVNLCLERIEATQGTLNAFRIVRAEAAVAEAEEADRRLAAGERLPLLGVPFAIKDDVDLAGEPTAFGCSGPFPVKDADSEAVRRLKGAGAVIVGKTNAPEIGQWPFTEGPAFGMTRNPWSLDHSPAGSSGGSAAAVAAGLVPGATGADGAGSVRIPAAWTHLVGVKPQRGRISTWPEPESFNGLTVIGPLTRTVGDAALLLDVLSGNVAGDLHRPPAPPETFAQAASRDPGKLRIALSFRIPFSGAPARLDPEVRAAVERLAEVLEGMGHSVAHADPSYGLDMGASFMPRSMPALKAWVQGAPDRSQLDPRTRHNALVGHLLSPLHRPARAYEGILRRRVGRIFRRFDVVLAPTTAQPPLPVGACEGFTGWKTDQRIVAACPYAWPWNVLGWPGVNVPAGRVAGDLPVGASLLGPANSEPRLLALAARLEAHERWHEHLPANRPR
jgi:amidase